MSKAIMLIIFCLHGSVAASAAIPSRNAEGGCDADTETLMQTKTKVEYTHAVDKVSVLSANGKSPKARVGADVNGKHRTITSNTDPATWNTTGSDSSCLFSLTVEREWGDDSIVDVQGEPGDTFIVSGFSNSEDAVMVRTTVTDGQKTYKYSWSGSKCQEEGYGDGANQIVRERDQQVVGYVNCENNPSEVKASSMIACVPPSWTQCGGDNSKCPKCNNKHNVDSQAICEAEARAANAKFYNYNERDGLCSYTASCSDPKDGSSKKPWKIYSEDPSECPL